MNKKQKSTFRWLLDAAVAFFAGLFGLSSCNGIDLDNPFDKGLCMYGCPTSEYCVYGRVVDESGKPVKGIKIVGDQYNPKTYYTDGDGSFHDEFNSSNGILRYFIEDVDGPDNGGQFARDTIIDSNMTQKLNEKKSDPKANNGFGIYNYDVTFTKTLKKE